jgi:hypothetical protein
MFGIRDFVLEFYQRPGKGKGTIQMMEESADERNVYVLDPSDDIHFTDENFVKAEYTYLWFRSFEWETGQAGGPISDVNSLIRRGTKSRSGHR